MWWWRDAKNAYLQMQQSVCQMQKKTGRNIWVVQPVIAVGSALATIYYMKKNLCLFFLSDDDVKVVRIWISTG